MSDHADTIRGKAIAALNALVAERQQAIDERDAALAALKDELQWDFGGPGAKRIEQLEAQLQQAIDALRGIARWTDPRTDTVEELIEFACAALVSLGEKP